MDEQNITSVHPKKLKSDAETHESFVFGAVAELIDNAKDEGATRLDIDYDEQMNCLIYTDNGNGMNWEKCRQMMCHGNSSKGEKDIGKFGVGFKSGSMRQADDALVLTSDGNELIMAFLSQTFLQQTEAQMIKIPMASWDKNFSATRPVAVEDFEAVLSVPLGILPIDTIEKLHDEFKKIPVSGSGVRQGTRICLFNLRKGKNHLDFSDPSKDILVPGRSEEKKFMKKRPTFRISADIPIDYSLKQYCAVLFKPKANDEQPPMQIYVRGAKVKQRDLRRRLLRRWDTKFEVQWEDDRQSHTEIVEVTYGYSVKDAARACSGHFIYCAGRLVESYWQIGVQRAAGGQAHGVIGVLDCPFLRVLNSKQGFHQDSEDRLSQVEEKLEQLVDKYFEENIEGKDLPVEKIAGKEDTLQAGEACWAKATGYDYYWPSFIMNEDDVPANVLKQKKKNCLIVCFFAENAENSFAWVHKKNLLRYRGQQNPNLLKSANGKTKNLIPKRDQPTFSEAVKLADEHVETFDENEQTTKMMQCRECMKWRLVQFEDATTSDWYCWNNKDKRYSSCKVPEQDTVLERLKKMEEEQQPKLKKMEEEQQPMDPLMLRCNILRKKIEKFINAEQASEDSEKPSADVEATLAELELVQLDDVALFDKNMDKIRVIQKLTKKKRKSPTLTQRLIELWKKWKKSIKELRLKFSITVWAFGSKDSSSFSFATSHDQQSAPSDVFWERIYPSDKHYEKDGKKDDFRDRVLEQAPIDCMKFLKEKEKEKDESDSIPPPAPLKLEQVELEPVSETIHADRSQKSFTFRIQPVSPEKPPQLMTGAPTKESLWFATYPADDQYIEDGKLENFRKRCRHKAHRVPIVAGILEGRIEAVSPGLFFDKNKRLGRGPNSEVFEGQLFRQAEFGIEQGSQVVAVKRVPKHLKSLCETEREIILNPKLEHKNIARVFRFEEDDSFVYCASEICYRSLNRVNFIPNHIKDRIALFRGLCKGLCFLHSQDLIHGNLKPTNCFIQEDNITEITAKLADLDFKKLAQDPSFLVPEQRNDINNLRRMLYFLLEDNGREGIRFEERNPSYDELRLSIRGEPQEQRYQIESNHFLRISSIDPDPSSTTADSRLINLLNHPMFWVVEGRFMLLNDVLQAAQKDSQMRTLLSAMLRSKNVLATAQSLQRQGFMSQALSNEIGCLEFISQQWWAPESKRKSNLLDFFPDLFLCLFAFINVHFRSVKITNLAVLTPEDWWSKESLSGLLAVESILFPVAATQGKLSGSFDKDENFISASSVKTHTSHQNHLSSAYQPSHRPNPKLPKHPVHLQSQKHEQSSFNTEKGDQHSHDSPSADDLKQAAFGKYGDSEYDKYLWNQQHGKRSKKARQRRHRHDSENKPSLGPRYRDRSRERYSSRDRGSSRDRYRSRDRDRSRDRRRSRDRSSRDRHRSGDRHRRRRRDDFEDTRGYKRQRKRSRSPQIKKWKASQFGASSRVESIPSITKEERRGRIVSEEKDDSGILGQAIQHSPRNSTVKGDVEQKTEQGKVQMKANLSFSHGNDDSRAESTQPAVISEDFLGEEDKEPGEVTT